MNNLYRALLLFAAILSNCNINVAQSPQWKWIKSISTAGESNCNGMATDFNDNVFIAGAFWSPTITFGSITLSNTDNTGISSDVYLAKYDSSGNVIWAKSGGGDSSEFVTGIITDLQGNCYVMGIYRSDTISFGSFTLANPEFPEEGYTFITKYDASGNVTWAKSMGSFYFTATGIAIDRNNNIYIAITTSNAPVVFGSDTLTDTAGVYIMKCDSAGEILRLKRIGISGPEDLASGLICTDRFGNLFVSGGLSGTGVFGDDTLFGNGQGFFITKQDSAGNDLWTKSLGNGSGWDFASGIYSDFQGSLIMTGQFQSSILTFGADTLFNAGNDPINPTPAIFISKYDSSGNFLWAKSAGGVSSDGGAGVCADNLGNVYVTGDFRSPFITFGPDTLINHSSLVNGYADYFTAKFDISGNLFWAISGNGSIGSGGAGICADPLGDIYSMGTFGPPDIIFGNDTSYGAGSNNIYINKMENSPTAIVDVDNAFASLDVFPNPSNGNIYFKGAVDNSKIDIYDVIGGPVYSSNCIDNPCLVNLKEMPDGVYFYRITGKDLSALSGKIIIDK